MGLSERQQELISALVDNALQGDELREAEELVSSDAEAGRLLESYREDLARMKALPQVKAEPRHRARLVFPQPSSTPRWLKAAAILLLLGGAAWLYWKRPIRTLVLQLAAETRVEPGQHKLVHIFPGLRGRLVAASATHFKCLIDGVGGHPSEAHLMLSYDFNGDGAYDRVETYHLQTDAAPGWQEITDQTARLIETEGQELRDFADGALKAEIQCIHPQNALLASIQEITLPNQFP